MISLLLEKEAEQLRKKLVIAQARKAKLLNERREGKEALTGDFRTKYAFVRHLRSNNQSQRSMIINLEKELKTLRNTALGAAGSETTS